LHHRSMILDSRYRRDERLMIRLAVGLGAIAGVLAFVFVQFVGKSAPQASPEKVWSYLQENAPDRNLDPGFVYALAWAESSLNPRAESSVARGIMQLTKPTWKDVSDKSYRHAWDWRTNIDVALDYLAFCRELLEKNQSFSYPLLAAAYRYGPYYVKNRNFDMNRIRQPKNEIYRRIFAGNIRPVAPPN